MEELANAKKLGLWMPDMNPRRHYKQAIDAAKSSIYLENQALPVPEIVVRLEEALKRGVEIVLLVPDPESYVLLSLEKWKADEKLYYIALKLSILRKETLAAGFERRPRSANRQDPS